MKRKGKKEKRKRWLGLGAAKPPQWPKAKLGVVWPHLQGSNHIFFSFFLSYPFYIFSWISFFFSDVAFFLNKMAKLIGADSMICACVDKLLAIMWPSAYMSLFTIKKPKGT
jgi:hypothetical protein